MKEVEVSIIVPVCNAEKYLDECINSIVCQTFHNIEIILVVAKSKDNSIEKCNYWQNRDKRIRVINEKQTGLGPARMQAVYEDAVGEFIAFVDADDIIESTFIEKMYGELVASQADMVECDFYRMREYSETLDCGQCSSIWVTFLVGRIGFFWVSR